MKYTLFAHSAVFAFETREELENYKAKLAAVGIQTNYKLNHAYGLFTNKKQGGDNVRRAKTEA